MCRNGGVGINLLFILCSVQALKAVDCWLFPSKCAFSVHSKAKLLFWPKQKVAESSIDVTLVPHT